MSFTTKIDLSLSDKLRQDLSEQGFELSKPLHTVFSAKKKGVSCTLYESGTLMVQGKEKDPFIEFYLEPEILKTFSHSNPEVGMNLTPRIGMDEAGKGDFFGPLCVAALYASEENLKELTSLGVKDSKKLSDTTILKVAQKLKERFPYTIVRLFPQKYNELYARFKNLNRLLAWAHSAALGDLSQKTGCKFAILDQFADESVVLKFLEQKKIDVDLVQRTKGESDPVVAAASIIARASFVEGMQRLSEEYGMQIPFGAGPQVLTAARALTASKGKEVLPLVAKTHFKTMGRLS